MPLDFFGLPDDIARDHDDSIAQAWYLRQRDTHAALRHADAAALSDDASTGRIALVRGEAAWLFNRLADADMHLAQARAAFASAHDAVGLGDADMLHASLLDQTGGDRSAALRAAAAHYRTAGDSLREHIAATFSACVEATADPDDAEASWGQALREATALQHPGLATYVEGANGTLAWRRGDPAAAITAFQRGFDAAVESGQLQSAITLAQNVGIAFSTLNDHEGALAWADRARDLVRPTGWPYATAWCLMQTGSILLGLRRAQAAKALLLEGMPSLQGCEGSRNHALACQILGEACLELRQHDEALHWCEAAQAGALKLAYPDLVSGSLRHMALALSRLGRVDEAVAAAQRALAIAEAQHDWQRVATTDHVLSQIAREHGLPPPAGSAAASGAIHHLQAALAHGARMPGFVAAPEWHAQLSADHEAAGHLAQALACEREASRLRDQVQSRRAEEMATAMLVRHRTEASELRAALVETQAALEKERMQSLLVHAGKMVAIGRLASGVVHEMSHPVGTLLLLAESLQERLADGELAGTARTLVGETRRLQQFIVRLRDFARADPPQLARHDLRSVLADARQLFAPRLSVERVRYAEDVPSLAVNVDPQRLALAVANLVFNAADALKERAEREVRIEASAVGDTVELRVEDNGPGLPEAVRARLFEPFFTTKPEGQGLGLGLALSAESLAAMGGRIVADNRAEGGARFTIVLPRP